MNNICSWRNLHEQFSFSKWVSLSPVKRELKNWDKLCPRILGEGKFRRNKILLNVKKFIWVAAGWSCVLLNWHQTGAQLYLILSPDIFSCIKECRIVWRCREGSLREYQPVVCSILEQFLSGGRWWEADRRLDCFHSEMDTWTAGRKERARNNGRVLVYQVCCHFVFNVILEMRTTKTELHHPKASMRKFIRDFLM